MWGVFVVTDRMCDAVSVSGSGSGSAVPVIGLVMIVKNEEAVIERALRSAFPSFVTTYVIVDTGSTDRTKEIIRSVLADVSGGLLVDRPWVDFGTNRSEALALCDGRMDWAIMMDADDSLAGVAPPASFWTETEADAYNMCLHHSVLRHQRTQVFRTNRGWRYKGVVHEFPDSAGRLIKDIPPNMYIETRCEGVRSRDPEKFTKDAAALEKELATECATHCVTHRTLFYLAQSYRDAGKMGEAERVYRQYLTVPDGSNQQRYMVLVNLITIVSDVKETAAWAWEAIDLCPHRLEAPFAFVQKQRFAGRPVTHQTLALATVVRNRTLNRADLFSNAPIYEWGMDDELAVVASAMGRCQEAYDASMRCALNAPSTVGREIALKNARIERNKMNILSDFSRLCHIG